MDELHHGPAQHHTSGGMVPTGANASPHPGLAPDGTMHPGMAGGGMAPDGLHHTGAAGMGHPGIAHPGMGPEHPARQKLGLPAAAWAAVDAAIRHQLRESRLHKKFLTQVFVSASNQHVPADAVVGPTSPTGVANNIAVDETASVFMIETAAQVALTQSQLALEASTHEMRHQQHLHHQPHPQHSHHHQDGHTHASTLVTLGVQAAKLLAAAEDSIVMLGASLTTNPLIVIGKPNAANPNTVISVRKLPENLGTLNLPQSNTAPLPPLGLLPQSQIFSISPVTPFGRYQDRLLDVVAAAYGWQVGHLYTGPHVCVVDANVYADAFQTIPGTFTFAAQGIKELMPAGFYGTALLPRASGSTPAAPYAGYPSGQITTVSVLNAGSGYGVAPTVTFAGGGQGSGATGTVPAANIVGGAITGVNVINPGAGYTVNQPVTFVGGGGSGAAGIANVVAGVVQGVNMTSQGQGYTAQLQQFTLALPPWRRSAMQTLWRE